MASTRHPFLAAVIATVLKRIDDFDAFKYLRNSWSAVIHTTDEEPYTKGILEVIDLHLHRLVNMESDFGTSHCVFGSSSQDVHHHQKLYSIYAMKPSPLIQQKWPLTCLFSLISTLRQLSRATKSMLAAGKQNR